MEIFGIDLPTLLGTAGVIIVSVLAIAKAIVALTPSEKDDEIVDKIESIVRSVKDDNGSESK